MTGGMGPNDAYLDSTELYDPSVGSWAMSGARLPAPMETKAVNIDGRVLIFGKSLNSL